MMKKKTCSSRRRVLMLAIACALATITCALGACSSLSGYDPNRYASTPASSDSADPETAPLPKTKRFHMLDPRSPLPSASAASSH